MVYKQWIKFLYDVITLARWAGKHRWAVSGVKDPKDLSKAKFKLLRMLLNRLPSVADAMVVYVVCKCTSNNRAYNDFWTCDCWYKS